LILPAAALLIDQLKPSLLEAVVAYPVVVDPTVNLHVGSVLPVSTVMAVGVPTAGVGLTVIAKDDLASSQTPFLTTTRYLVVVVKFENDCVALVLAMLDQLSPPSTENSQRKIEPV
jgi:hypothetical protein